MSKKLSTVLLLILLPLMGYAQDVYTDYLQKQIAGYGQVILHQDAEIARLVNGGAARLRQPKESSVLSGEMANVEEDGQIVAPSGRHTVANGYRVQIASLGSTTKDKEKAESLGRSFKTLFPGVNVYTKFRSPHYVCMVGDFKTREEAAELLQQMRETRQFATASIVRSKINIYY